MYIHDPDELVKAFEAMEDQDTSEFDPSSIDEVRITMGSYNPVSWQVTIRFRDARLLWAIGTGDNPGDALVTAVKKIGKGGVAAGGAYYYPKKEVAEDYRRGLEEIYGDQIRWAKTEFEPGKGFVVVVCLAKGVELKKLKGKVEFRENRPPAHEKGVAPSKETTPKASTAGGSSMSKPDMEKIWKAKHGKNPDRNIKKADLWDLLVEQGLVSPDQP